MCYALARAYGAGWEKRKPEEEEKRKRGRACCALLGRMDLILDKIYPLSLSSAVKNLLIQSPRERRERKILQMGKNTKVSLLLYCTNINCIYLYTASVLLILLLESLGTLARPGRVLSNELRKDVKEGGGDRETWEYLNYIRMDGKRKKLTRKIFVTFFF